MNDQIKGAGLIFIASAFVAASTLCAKVLGTGDAPLPAFQVTFGRYLFGFAGLLAALVVVKPKFTAPRWPLHGLRIFCGVVGVAAMFSAVSFIPLSDVTAISFLNPIFAMVIAIVVLGEKVGPIRWLMAFTAFCGAMLLIRPGTSGFQPAALLALVAAVVFGVEVITIKILARGEGAFQIIFIANAIGAIVSGILAIFFWVNPTPEQWIIMAATGLLMVTAQVFYTNALRIGEASFVLPFAYATLVFATLYDFILFDVVPVPLSIAGGIVIVISGVVLAWRESRAAVSTKQTP